MAIVDDTDCRHDLLERLGVDDARVYRCTACGRDVRLLEIEWTDEYEEPTPPWKGEDDE